MRNFAIYFILVLACLTLSGSIHDPGNPKVSSGSDNVEKYDVTFYLLDLNISDTSTFLQGHVYTRLIIQDQSALHVTFDMSDLLYVDSVRINSMLAEFTHKGNNLTISLPSLIMPGVHLEADVFYHGLGKSAGEVSGIYNKYNSSWNKRITYTLSESYSALNWFPCHQSLTDKADSAYIFLSTDKNLKAGSNGVLKNIVTLPGDRVRYEWKCRYPIDYYLISFAVGDYMDYSFYAKPEDGSDSILIQNYIYNDSAYFEQNKANIDKTAEIINLYSKLFGAYPFKSEKYGHCVAPLGGGMEHQTMTTLVNFAFLLVSHELSHQWFGDYVTCKTWQDIWINEGFASYAEYIANQYLVSQSVADGWMSRTQDFVKTLSGGSVFVPESSLNNENRIFDSRLTYSKGAAIIHMIRQETGNDDLFFQVLREFLRRFKNGNASGLDFRDLLSEMTGKDFDRFFEQWYFGEGFPNLTINWAHNHDSLYISSLQTSSASTPVFDLMLEYQITVNGRDTLITHRQDSSFDEWHVYLPGKVTAITLDPRHWLLMNISGIGQSGNINKNSRYVIMPNPARDKITLSFNEPVDNYEVHLADASGKILFTEKSKSNRKTIDIEKLPKGMYFVIVNEKNLIYPARFIKN